MKIEIIECDCIGCGLCTQVAPDFFDLNEDEKSFVKRQPGTTQEEMNCQEAADSCPGQAIEIS